MASTTRLRSDERIGLIVAIAAHCALFALLVFQANRQPAFVAPPERVTVSLAEDIGLASAAPEIAEDAQASTAPEIGADTDPTPKVEVPKEPVRQPPPAPPRRNSLPDALRNPPPPPVSRDTSGARLSDEMLKGQGSSEAPALVPASEIGAAARASLQQAIARQIRPHWKPPSGADSDSLVTILAFDLNSDGSLKGKPRLVRQIGITDANRPQAGRHVELAIRAVTLAAPFDLPEEHYNAWKRITSWRFDWKSAQ